MPPQDRRHCSQYVIPISNLMAPISVLVTSWRVSTIPLLFPTVYRPIFKITARYPLSRRPGNESSNHYTFPIRFLLLILQYHDWSLFSIMCPDFYDLKIWDLCSCLYYLRIEKYYWRKKKRKNQFYNLFQKMIQKNYVNWKFAEYVLKVYLTWIDILSIQRISISLKYMWL